jgi:hypothetical protein
VIGLSKPGGDDPLDVLSGGFVACDMVVPAPNFSVAALIKMQGIVSTFSGMPGCERYAGGLPIQRDDYLCGPPFGLFGNEINELKKEII